MSPSARLLTGLALATLACAPGPEADAPPEYAFLGACEARFAEPERAWRCLVDRGWDSTVARDRIAYLRHRLAADDTNPGTDRISASRAANLAGQHVLVVDSVVGIVLGTRRQPFEILLGTDSTTAPLRLTVEWKRLARFPVLKWRYRVLAASGTVTTHEGNPALVLDAADQARLVRRERESGTGR